MRNSIYCTHGMHPINCSLIIQPLKGNCKYILNQMFNKIISIKCGLFMKLFKNTILNQQLYPEYMAIHKHCEEF